MQTKTNKVADISSKVGLNINRKKTKLLRTNITNEDAIRIHGEPIEDVKSITYLGSIVDDHGGTDANVKARIGKARADFIKLRNMWNT